MPCHLSDLSRNNSYHPGNHIKHHHGDGCERGLYSHRGTCFLPGMVVMALVDALAGEWSSDVGAGTLVSALDWS